MSKQKKNPTSAPHEKLKKQPGELSTEQRLLIDRADSMLVNPFSDKKLDEENEKRRLIGLYGIPVYEKYILAKSKPYTKKFPDEFYSEIYRLHGWKRDKKSLQNRPAIIGIWTNEIIYCRFTQGVLESLRKKNPYIINGVRLYKHFQWLSDAGDTELLQYIDDAIKVMKKCTYWDEFKMLFAKENGKSYQLSLFDYHKLQKQENK